MISITKKCSNQPCTIEHRTDGEWVDFAYTDPEMTAVAVFSCEHDAYVYVLEAIVHFITLSALGEVEVDDVPTLDNFRLVFADTLQEPAMHDDCISDVSAATELLQKYRRPI